MSQQREREREKEIVQSPLHTNACEKHVQSIEGKSDWTTNKRMNENENGWILIRIRAMRAFIQFIFFVIHSETDSSSLLHLQIKTKLMQMQIETNINEGEREKRSLKWKMADAARWQWVGNKAIASMIGVGFYLMKYTHKRAWIDLGLSNL